MPRMKRRELVLGSLAAGAAVAAGTGRAQVPAIPSGLRPGERKLFEIAKEKLARHGAGLWHRDLVGVADFGLHSSEKRLHFVDFERGKVDSYHCAHGMGSDPEHDGWLNWFSNVHESWCTSQGAYMTFSWYVGRFGTSMRLEGLEPTNSNALDRAIVMHRAAYCEPEHIARYGKLGRSNGCFAMSNTDFQDALLRLSGGRLLYADRIGLAADGSIVGQPPREYELLVPEGPRPLAPGSF
jgi:hypothetical protein